ncbi:alpha/beta fold hydrolase [Elstera cyanobacteriorum]|uniref:alpha/beta fold hydrolase n=1 Tax=Elstera cyanobacteriorum TaxID=2022747 RepID=UPI002352F836|nr:alpha/beta hydrolase [Elstera cyanobacteriorum]MCK6443291.1 alpha/beta hydrolase [Elstera cyanobacteriorum]
MSFITAQDGTQIFYKDWGPKTGQPIVFSHGWPLSADAWDGQMLHFALKGFRVIAHDRRSHGRSDQTATGNDMDTYADDLAAVLSALDVNNAVLVGHSTGGGEVAHYIGRHGTGRVAKAVLVGAVPPRMSKSDAYPNGLPLDIFDGIRAGVAANRSQFYLDLTTPFYGFNRPGKSVNDGLRLDFWRQGMAGGIVGQYACIREFSEVDYTDDLKKIDVPTLFIHGSDDQIVPIGHAAELAVTLVPNGTLIVYDGADHGLAQTHADRFNADLLAFIQK